MRKIHEYKRINPSFKKWTSQAGQMFKYSNMTIAFSEVISKVDEGMLLDKLKKKFL